MHVQVYKQALYGGKVLSIFIFRLRCSDLHLCSGAGHLCLTLHTKNHVGYIRCCTFTVLRIFLSRNFFLVRLESMLPWSTGSQLALTGLAVVKETRWIRHNTDWPTQMSTSIKQTRHTNRCCMTSHILLSSQDDEVWDKSYKTWQQYQDGLDKTWTTRTCRFSIN